jgi:hypothetical protein
MESVMYGLGYGHTTSLNPPPSCTTLPKSGNTYLGDDNGHQGEIGKNAQI